MSEDVVIYDPEHDDYDPSHPLVIAYRREERRLKMRLDNANIPGQHWGKTFDDLDPYIPGQDGTGLPADLSAKFWVKRFIEGEVVEGTGQGLLFYGSPGHGKTALSAVMLQEALRGTRLTSWGQRWTSGVQPARGGYMAPYRHLVSLTQRQFNNGTSEADDNLLLDVRGDRGVATAVRLLVLDDVGKEHRTSSGWAAGFFEELIRTRFYEGWPTVLTTNIDPKNWGREYGESCENFLHEAFLHVHTVAPDGDRRRAAR